MSGKSASTTLSLSALSLSADRRASALTFLGSRSRHE